MVKLDKIYTRGGDGGMTSLATGGRIAKTTTRIAAIGAVDEANAALGLAGAALGNPDPGNPNPIINNNNPDNNPGISKPDQDHNEKSNNPATIISKILLRVQNDLFDLGADLAAPSAEPASGSTSDSRTDRGKRSALRIVAEQVNFLEQELDRLTPMMPPLNSFILPGGTPLAAALHAARTTVRRTEIACQQLASSEQINPFVLQYINRLSDLLFVLARLANADSNHEILWKPGKHRSL